MFLSKGDTVIVISPAGRVLNENIDHAVSILEDWGLKVLLSSAVKKEYYNFSGTVTQRRDDLQWALNHTEAKAIFASRGGYGTIHLLDKIDWSIFEEYPKLMIGYSDICNLHAQINNIGIASLHALMPNSFPKGKEQQLSLATLKQSLFADDYSLVWVVPHAIDDFHINAPIVGGNLSILYSLQGTPYAPSYVDAILFIEDLCEYYYHIDRMLHSMAYAGVFSEIQALIVGDFSDLKDNPVPFGKNIEELILDIVSPYGVPVIFGLKTGHSDPTLALPLGKLTLLSVKQNLCTLQF